jgi:septal ring factor EnvC (AmiA/AmiB activator)
MRHLARVAIAALLLAFAWLLFAGCAGTRSTNEDIPDDPVLIQKELVEIRQDMRNTEEMIKGTKAQLQIDDNQAIRDEIRSLEMHLIHLESQKRALEERLAEIDASGRT